MLDLSHVDESGQARFSPKETLQCGRCTTDDVAWWCHATVRVDVVVVII